MSDKDDLRFACYEQKPFWRWFCFLSLFQDFLMDLQLKVLNSIPLISWSSEGANLKILFFEELRNGLDI